MIKKPILLTLTWRWRTIGCLPFWGFATLAIVAASSLVESLARGLWKLVSSASIGRDYGHAILTPPTSVWFSGLGLGFVLAWTVHELLRCPVSASLPRLRVRLACEVGVAIAAIWILSEWVLSDSRVAVSAPRAAVGCVGTGVGLVVANPGRFRTLLPAAALAVGIPTVAAILERAHPWIVAHATVASAGLGALAIGCVAFALSAGEHRRILAEGADPSAAHVDPVQLDMSHRDRSAASRWALDWRGGREWAGATLHELHGGGAWGWRLLNAYYLVVLVAVLVMIPATDRRGTGLWSWRSIASNALGEDREIWRAIMTFWLLVIGVWAVGAPCVPRVGFVRPTSRAERARAAWRVCALRATTVLGGAAAVAGLLAAVGSWRSASADHPAIPVRGVPDLLGAILILAVITPWAAWVRLRLLDLSPAHGRFPSPLRQGVVASVVVAGCLVAGHVLGSGWFAAEELHPALAPLLFAPAVVASWLGYRAELDRLFRTVALPV